MIPRGQSTVTGLSLRRMRNEKSPRNTWERFDAGQDMQNGQEAGATLCVYITVTNTLRVTMQYLRVPFYGPNPCSGRYFVIPLSKRRGLRTPGEDRVSGYGVYKILTDSPFWRSTFWACEDKK